MNIRDVAAIVGIATGSIGVLAMLVRLVVQVGVAAASIHALERHVEVMNTEMGELRDEVHRLIERVDFLIKK